MIQSEVVYGKPVDPWEGHPLFSRYDQMNQPRPVPVPVVPGPVPRSLPAWADLLR